MSGLPACYGIIPARYGSTRFPGKPLTRIHGMPMFWHVYERASRCALLTRVVLATDDERILDEAKRLGAEALMTDPAHASGTDRVYEAATILGLPEQAVVLNIQGDEPALAPEMLAELAGAFADPRVQVATLARLPDPNEDLTSPDRVKLVRAANGDALYFSRAPIPYEAATLVTPTRLLHVGLYGFRLPALRRFTELPQSMLERTEKLEQLRLLENGIPIRVALTERRSHGVDRPEDVAVVSPLVLETNLCKHC
jgi:3-deoxy-manno-octulosonate cytidylyltransferase (CMP-KDO synthetase)